MLVKDKLIVQEVNLNHRNHMTDQQTYDHYPENVRLSGEVLVTAQQMIRVGGNKKKIKLDLTRQTGKPVLMKTLHNIQTKDQAQKFVGPDDAFLKLYDILAAISNANVCFITDEGDELVGRLSCRSISVFFY